MILVRNLLLIVHFFSFFKPTDAQVNKEIYRNDIRILKHYNDSNSYKQTVRRVFKSNPEWLFNEELVYLTNLYLNVNNIDSSIIAYKYWLKKFDVLDDTLLVQKSYASLSENKLFLSKFSKESFNQHLLSSYIYKNNYFLNCKEALAEQAGIMAIDQFIRQNDDVFNMRKAVILMDSVNFNNFVSLVKTNGWYKLRYQDKFSSHIFTPFLWHHLRNENEFPVLIDLLKMGVDSGELVGWTIPMSIDCYLSEKNEPIVYGINIVCLNNEIESSKFKDINAIDKKRAEYGLAPLYFDAVIEGFKLPKGYVPDPNYKWSKFYDSKLLEK
jgi:hypothetical protein